MCVCAEIGRDDDDIADVVAWGGVLAVGVGVSIWVAHVIQVLCLLPTTC